MVVPLWLFVRLETALEILAPCLETKIDLIRKVALGLSWVNFLSRISIS